MGGSAYGIAVICDVCGETEHSRGITLDAGDNGAKSGRELISLGWTLERTHDWCPKCSKASSLIRKNIK